MERLRRWRPRRPIRAGLAAIWLTACGGGAGAAPGPEDLDPFALAEKIDAVSDGELRFLEPAATRGVHRHLTRIRITADSLADGWVELDQCHEQLDAVPRAAVVFHAVTTRGLAVRTAAGIGKAEVVGNSVELSDIEPGASLCISAQSRALHAVDDELFRLRNGPFMRKFLDGYYPMEIGLEVAYPPELLVVTQVSPAGGPGVSVEATAGQVSMRVGFEGRLFTCVDFSRAGLTGGTVGEPCTLD